MGRWIENDWVWNLTWRRELFEWEKPILSNLLETISNYQPTFVGEDTITWRLDKSGMYTVKSMYDEALSKQLGADLNLAGCENLVWTGLVPPSVELLSWCIILGKIRTKDKLVAWKIIPLGEISCVFCNLEPETVDHIFSSCSWSKRIWSEICLWWQVEPVVESDNVSFLKSWFEKTVHWRLRKLWRSTLFATWWTIWECRNNAIFDNKPVDLFETVMLIKLRVGLWCKAWNKDIEPGPSTIMNNLVALKV